MADITNLPPREGACVFSLAATLNLAKRLTNSAYILGLAVVHCTMPIGLKGLISQTKQ